MKTDLALYLDTYYGTCKLTVCHCLKSRLPWRGTACSDWVPTGARTWEELREKIGPGRETRTPA